MQTTRQIAMQTIVDNISTEELTQVHQPIERARGMPNRAYTDPQAFLFEREHVFAPGWAALAFADEVAANQSVKPIEFMQLPLLLTRTPPGEINVFHNVCSHRGMRLVAAPRATNGMLVCPYHAWSYDLDGNLKATPHIGGVGKHTLPGFACERHALKRVRSHVWLGVIFINLSGDAPPFDHYVKPLRTRYNALTGQQGLDELRLPSSDGCIEFEVRCNWKLAVENYTEAYHLPWVHPSLNRYSPLEKHHNAIISDDFSGQITHCFNPQFANAKALPVFSHWPTAQYQHAEYPTFYPNLFLGFQVNHLFALIVQPQAVDKSRETVRLFYVGEQAANNAAYAQTRKVNWQAWQKIFKEDVGAVEGMQLGRQSPGYQGGAFSPVQDTCSHHFHRWVARKYLAAR